MYALPPAAGVRVDPKSETPTLSLPREGEGDEMGTDQTESNSLYLPKATRKSILLILSKKTKIQTESNSDCHDYPLEPRHLHRRLPVRRRGALEPET
jgi:hypothetical protein